MPTYNENGPDLRNAIPRDTQLGEYTILFTIGSGGSALCYAAISEDNRRVVIKETYHRDWGALERDKETYQLLDVPSTDTAFAVQTEEERIAQIFRDPEGNNTGYIFHYSWMTYGGVRYSVIDTEGGKMLSDLLSKLNKNRTLKALPTLKDVLQMMMRIVEAIEPIHARGYLHGDIAPDNLFISEVQQGDSESGRTVKPIDFNSAFRLDEKQGHRFTNKGEYSPEEFIDDNLRSQVCFGSDLYSVAVMLASILLGTQYRRDSHEDQWIARKAPSLAYFEKETKEVRDATWKLLQDAILDRIEGTEGKSACVVFKERLSHIIELIDHPHRWGNRFSAKELFTVGRDSEMQEIATIIRRGSIPVLHSMGGLGKSHLAKAFSQNPRMRYKTVLFIPYVGSLRNTIFSDKHLPITNFSMDTALTEYQRDVLPSEEQEKIYFEEKLSQIKNLLTRNTLIILDGMNTTKDMMFAEFVQWDCDKIITTRNDFSVYQKIAPVVLVKLKEIDDIAELERLFEKHYISKIYPWELSEDERTVIRIIISTARRHTLLVELIAKSARASRIDLSKLADNISNTVHNRYPNIPIQHIQEGIELEDNEGTVDAIIQKVFDLSNLSDSQNRLLRHLCLFPDSGISRAQFMEWVPNISQSDILALNHNGWLRWDEGQDVISLHQLIAEVYLTRFNPCCDDYTTFLTRLIQFTTSINITNYEQYTLARNIFQAIKEALSDHHHSLFNTYELHMAHLHLSFDSHPLAEELFHSVYKRNMDEKSSYLAQSFLLTIAVEKQDKIEAESLIHAVEHSPYFSVFKEREMAFFLNKAWLFREYGDVQSLYYAAKLCEDILANNPISDETPLSIRMQVYHAQYILASTYFSLAKYTDTPNEYYKKAKSNLQQTIDKKRTDFPFRPNLTYADRNMLASCQFHLRDFSDAYQSHRELFDEKAEYYPPDSRTMAVAYRNLVQAGYARYSLGENLDIKELLDNIERGLTIAKLLNLQEILVFLYSVLFQIYVKQNDEHSFCASAIELLEMILHTVVFNDKPKNFYLEEIAPTIHMFLKNNNTIDSALPTLYREVESRFMQ